MKYLVISLIVLIVIIMVLISKIPNSNNETADRYFSELEKTEITFKTNDVKNIFLKLFRDIKVGGNDKTIREIYADKIYFNDTFRTLHDIDSLIEYMTHTAETVKLAKVKILDTSKSESDYYIRWVMEMEFNAKGKDIFSQSIGMTQLRFDNSGKVIFHQDFWDSAEGFYQHLPYIGYVIRKIRSKL